MLPVVWKRSIRQICADVRMNSIVTRSSPPTPSCREPKTTSTPIPMRPLVTEIGADIVTIQTTSLDQESTIAMLGSEVLPELRSLEI